MDFVGLTITDVSSGMSREQIRSRNELTRICAELERLNGSQIDMTRTRNPFLNEDFVKRSLERRNMYFNRGFSDNVQTYLKLVIVLLQTLRGTMHNAKQL